jgi:hypothetical protein
VIHKIPKIAIGAADSITTAATPEYIDDLLRLGHEVEIVSQVLKSRNRIRPVTIICVQTARDSAIIVGTAFPCPTLNADLHISVSLITRATEAPSTYALQFSICAGTHRYCQCTQGKGEL